jgi:phenylalanyl-tRNA synthetase beta chain
MRFPESWLRAYVQPDWSTERLSDALTMAGLEVEEAGPYAPPFDRVVVAEVLTVARHPNADKLSVCEVDAGHGRTTIVCGAPNVAPGIRVPCALPGAVLPGNVTIRSAAVRGVDSQGMLCSARELGLSEDHSGLLILPPDAPVGQDVRRFLDLDDTVFLLKLTPNRPDCLGVYGIAREVAALSGAPLRAPAYGPVAVTISDRLPVRVSAPDLCGRFSGRVIRGVDARARTPEWMRNRLERAGQRSISALVDISNYVMLELSRPSHVFDLDKIHGGLDVRWGRVGECLKLLNGQTVEVDERVGVIADDRQLESLAGIMGGDSTAVSLDTTNVYVEAAFWWPQAIAGRARRFNFSTDAGHRFERGVDASTTVEHLEYLSALILEICGGRAGPVDDTVTALPERPPVALRVARAAKVIGAPIGEAEIAEAFERLKLPYAVGAGQVTVQPPPYRFDLAIEEDLIEEVARIWGFDRLPLRPPRAPAAMRPAPEARRPIRAVKRAVAARDYQEVINFSFVSSELDRRLTGLEGIALVNPIAAQLDSMRTTLMGSLLETLRGNLNRKAARVRIFEIGRVFLRDATQTEGPVAVAGIRQPVRIGMLAHGHAFDDQWGAAARHADFFDLKGDVEAIFGRAGLSFTPGQCPALHPGRSARVELDGTPIGWIGALHPALQQSLDLPTAPIMAELDLDPLLVVDVPKYAEVSVYPPAVRDLAFVVPDVVSARRILDEIDFALREAPLGRAVQNVKLFDEYRGKGLENKEKSLAFRFWMQDTQKTLSDTEVAEVLAVVVDRVRRTLGARLRS